MTDRTKTVTRRHVAPRAPLPLHPEAAAFVSHYLLTELTEPFPQVSRGCGGRRVVTVIGRSVVDRHRVLTSESSSQDPALTVVPMVGRLVDTADPAVAGSGEQTGAAGRGVLPGVAGGGSVGIDAAVLRAGSASLVPILVGTRACAGTERRGRRRVTSAVGCSSLGSRRAGTCGPNVIGRGRFRSVEPYAASVRAHSETVLRRSSTGRPGPAGAEPVPAGALTSGRENARSSQPDGAGARRAGRAVSADGGEPDPARSIPDEEFNEIFARLPSHRDPALVAFYVSTGARLRIVVGDPGPCRSRPPADHRGSQGPAPCSSCRRRRTRSSGCGSSNRRWMGGSRRGAASRSGGRCGARGDR